MLLPRLVFYIQIYGSAPIFGVYSVIIGLFLLAGMLLSSKLLRNLTS